jgi:hypothetical protein
MKVRLLIVLLISSLSAPLIEAVPNIPEAKRGVLDLRLLDKNQKFIVKLNGEWEFYWKKILRPYDFKTGAYQPDCYGRVPSYWTDYQKLSIKTDNLGYATYKLTILLPEGFDNAIGIDLPVFDSSYDIYVNLNIRGIFSGFTLVLIHFQ